MLCSALNILFAAKLITELCTKGMNELPEESGRGRRETTNKPRNAIAEILHKHKATGCSSRGSNRKSSGSGSGSWDRGRGRGSSWGRGGTTTNALLRRLRWGHWLREQRAEEVVEEILVQERGTWERGVREAENSFNWLRHFQTWFAKNSGKFSVCNTCKQTHIDICMYINTDV